MSELPDEAYAIALALLPKVGPATLRELTTGDVSLPDAWVGVTGGKDEARDEVERQWRHHCDLGLTVVLRSHPDYPSRLRELPFAPAVLFCRGDPAVLSTHPTVALVGTRSPTRYGIGVAAQLAADLSAAQVSVISGLALGIDGAAHEGACGAGAPPIAVVAGGVDEPYPRRHARLWQRVSELGVVVSESPAGGRTEKWRFPVRNRLMAALSDVVVVVESRHHGGSRHTVDAAMTLDRPVGAVPGSIRSVASEGTNALMAEGAFPVCSVTDILVALSLRGAHVTIPKKPAAGGPRDDLPPSERALYDALTFEPTSLDELARITGLDFAELCGGLERLAQAGFARDVGGWWERV
jgi:DNA processing protein